MKAMEASKSKITPWELVILFLCVYVLLELLAETSLPLTSETRDLLLIIDHSICFVFLVDFSISLSRSQNRLKYLKWGWIDLVSSIPNFQFLRIGRIARAVRIIRIIRGIRSSKRMITVVYQNKAQGILMSVFLLSFVVLVFASLAILNLENHPGSNIKTASDALWWAFVTITTVGYGDHYPVTTEGRILASILMVFGIGLFGVFTAYIASIFVHDNQNNEELIEAKAEISNLKAQLEKLKNK